MRVLLCGQKAFCAAVFHLIRDRGHEVAAVWAPHGDVALALAEPHVPAIRAGRLWPELIPDGCDLIVTAHCHEFIGRAARARSRLGALGYHPSLLPLHKGKDAVQAAIQAGDRVTGGSVYWLTDEMDGGPIAAQAFCFVRPMDTASELWRRELFPLGLWLLNQVLADLERGEVIAVPQDHEIAAAEPPGRSRTGAEVAAG